MVTMKPPMPMAISSRQTKRIDDSSKALHSEQPSSTKKLLNVSISILGLNGLYAKVETKQRGRSRTRARSQSWGRSLSRSLSRRRRSRTASRGRGGRSKEEKEYHAHGNGDDNNATSDDGTVIVATFERLSVTKKDNKGPSKKITSLPSLPLLLPTSNSNDNTENNDNLIANVIRWPEEETKQSTFTFQRHFPMEEEQVQLPTTTNNNTDTQHFRRPPRYVPQLFPIQLSLSRHGKLHFLGTARIFVNGEEDGLASANIPLTTKEEKKKNHYSSNIQKGGDSDDINFNSSIHDEYEYNEKNNDPVVLKKLKGDSTFQYGMANHASLRVLVRVWDPSMSMLSSSKTKKKKMQKVVLLFEDEEMMMKEKKMAVGQRQPSSLMDHFLCCYCAG